MQKETNDLLRRQLQDPAVRGSDIPARELIVTEKKSTAPDARDAQIRNLKDALCLARRTITDLMPEAFRAKLASLGHGTVDRQRI